MKREFVSTSVPVVINPAPMHAACEQALSWNKLAVHPGRVVGVNPGPVTGRAIVDQPCAAQCDGPADEEPAAAAPSRGAAVVLEQAVANACPAGRRTAAAQGGRVVEEQHAG